MLTNLKYFLGKRRCTLKSYCAKNKFLTYEALASHLEEVGVELPTQEETQFLLPPPEDIEGIKHVYKQNIQKLKAKKRSTGSTRSKKSRSAKKAGESS